MSTTNFCRETTVHSHSWPFRFRSVIAENDFVLIEASMLQPSDYILTHDPTTQEESVLKQLITQAIQMGVKNYWLLRKYLQISKSFPPFYTEELNLLDNDFPCSVLNKAAIDFAPSSHSRLETKMEYAAFLGVFIKRLVMSGCQLATAWDAACRGGWDYPMRFDAIIAKNATDDIQNIFRFLNINHNRGLLAETEYDDSRFVITSGTWIDFAGDYFYPLSRFLEAKPDSLYELCYPRIVLPAD